MNKSKSFYNRTDKIGYESGSSGAYYFCDLYLLAEDPGAGIFAPDVFALAGV